MLSTYAGELKHSMQIIKNRVHTIIHNLLYKYFLELIAQKNYVVKILNTYYLENKVYITINSLQYTKKNAQLSDELGI